MPQSGAVDQALSEQPEGPSYQCASLRTVQGGQTGFDVCLRDLPPLSCQKIQDGAEQTPDGAQQAGRQAVGAGHQCEQKSRHRVPPS